MEQSTEGSPITSKPLLDRHLSHWYYQAHSRCLDMAPDGLQYFHIINKNAEGTSTILQFECILL